MDRARVYARILVLQLKTSLALAFQYRADFLTEGLVEIFWTSTALAPLVVVFGARSEVAGWRFGEALMVTGFFTLLQAILEGAINPSMQLVVEQIRKGTFDFVLLKPVDAQFLVSTARVHPWRSVNVLTAIAFFAYGFVSLGRAPAPLHVATAAVLLVASVAIVHALWTMSVSVAFYVVKIDNLTFLFGAIFDAARWPASVFKGAVRFVFTFVIPLAIMTTFPAEALLGRSSLRDCLTALAGAALALGLSRLAWSRALGKYTSAGG